MKEKIGVYYASVPNMGDMLNKDIIEKCFGYEVVRHTYLTGKISGIGSGLGNYTYEEDVWKNILKFIFSFISPEVYIWGTGFIKYKEKDSKFYKRKTNICAVRGQFSKMRVEQILGHQIDVPMGDAGILADRLLSDMPKKKYDVGIIAHYKEQDNPVFKNLVKNFNNSIFIDVRKTPLEVTTQIAECRTIISSSLHGLIIADSLRVPNRHIVVTNNLLGDGYKFDDYYSAYGLEHEFTDLNREEIPSLTEVISSYKITDQMVDDKKKDMIRSFPFPPIFK